MDQENTKFFYTMIVNIFKSGLNKNKKKQV